MTLGSWQALFAAQAGVSAALTGLVFVALSINLSQILAGTGLAGRAGEALVLLLYPVITGLLGTSPQSSFRAVGVEFTVVALVVLAAVSRILWSARLAARERPRYEYLSRVSVGLLPVLAAVVGGVMLAAGVTGGIWIELTSTILCLISGVTDAWILLVEIMR